MLFLPVGRDFLSSFFRYLPYFSTQRDPQRSEELEPQDVLLQMGAL